MKKVDVFVQVLWEADTKTTLNLQEFYQENAYVEGNRAFPN